jgi:hypothetical protein
VGALSTDKVAGVTIDAMGISLFSLVSALYIPDQRKTYQATIAKNSINGYLTHTCTLTNSNTFVMTENVASIVDSRCPLRAVLADLQ